MWNDTKLQTWFARQVEIKNRVFTDVLPASHVRRHRGLIHHEVGNYLLWLAACTHRARGANALSTDELEAFVRVVWRHEPDSPAIAADLAAVQAYVAASPATLDERGIYRMDCSPHAHLFLERIHLPRLSFWRHPFKSMAYNKAFNLVRQTMQSGLVSELASLNLAQFRDHPKPTGAPQVPRSRQNHDARSASGVH